MSGPYREAPDYRDKKPWWFHFLWGFVGFMLCLTVYFVTDSLVKLRELRIAVARAQTNGPERRRLTLEQDRALCVRACGSHEFISTVCEWEPHGVRLCYCSCTSDSRNSPYAFPISEDR